MNKVIVTCAISGSGTVRGEGRGASPYIPVTVEEMVAEAKRAFDAGASIIHLHARDPKTNRSYVGGQMEENTSQMIAYANAIKEARPKAIINITTGGGSGQTFADKIDPVVKYQPPLASFTSGVYNFARYSKTAGKLVADSAPAMNFQVMLDYAEAFKKAGTKAEFEIYDAGHLKNITMINEIMDFDPNPMIQFVLGQPGQNNSPSVQHIVRLYEYAKELLGEGKFFWGAAAVGLNAWGVIPTVAYMGSSTIRTGLEDNIYMEPGVLAKSNGEMIEKLVMLARIAGREIASPEETVEILGLKAGSIL